MRRLVPRSAPIAEVESVEKRIDTHLNEIKDIESQIKTEKRQASEAEGAQRLTVELASQSQAAAPSGSSSSTDLPKINGQPTGKSRRTRARPRGCPQSSPFATKCRDSSTPQKCHDQAFRGAYHTRFLIAIFKSGRRRRQHCWKRT
jgi:hypothetical protein